MITFDIETWPRLSTRQIAEHVARDIPDGYWVNLGIGMPTEIAEVPITDREVVFHCENGLIGVGPRPEPGAEPADVINAGKQPVTLVPGASIVSHADSFGLIRGRHLDLAVLGAFEVSFTGDIANWTRPGDTIPAVGGAMDLAVGARDIWVMMTLFGKGEQCKFVRSCSYALTAAGVVSRVYTDMATFHIGPQGIEVGDLVEGLTVEQLSGVLGTELMVHNR